MKSFKEFALQKTKEVKEILKDELEKIEESKKDSLTEREAKAIEVEKYLRDAGYKIKSVDSTKYGVEIEFYKNNMAKIAKEELEVIPEFRYLSLVPSGKFLLVV